jgi:hypothetical protein
VCRLECPRNARIASAEQRDHDHSDDDEPDDTSGDADRSLPPPELRVGTVTAVATLGRGADPVIVVVEPVDPAKLHLTGHSFTGRARVVRLDAP